FFTAIIKATKNTIATIMLMVNKIYITLIPVRSYDSKLVQLVFLKYDICHTLIIFYFNFLPIILVVIVVNATMLIELKGIKIAAMTGSKFPVTANDNPITL